MSKISPVLAAFLFSGALYAQAPQQMSYQSIIRSASNALIVSKPIAMRVSILQGSATGTSIYEEIHKTSTNSNGLVNLNIGNGTVSLGSFASIDWSNGPFFVKIETDPNGGANYTISGTSQLLSVPYALYAANSGSSIPGPQGPKGAAGTNGVDGKSMLYGTTDPVSEGSVGDFYINTTTSMLFGPKTYRDWPAGISLVGAKGDKGDKGDTGLQGEAGLTGPKGDKGDAGLNGAPGVDGLNGLNGLKGDKGDTGLTGPQGEVGLTGPKGDKGDAGLNGAPGVDGLNGLNGAKGDKGDKGDTGLQGPAGLTTSVNGVTQVDGAITLTPTDLGLGNVNNTSDANKPVSTATQTALDLKAPLASPTFTGTVSGITKSMVGLGNVDNTSDANKPVSSATLDSLSLKAPLDSPTFTGTVSGISKSMVGLGSVDNTADADKPISTATQTALDAKQTKIRPTFEAASLTLSAVNSGSIIYTQHGGRPQFPENLDDGFQCDIVNYSNYAFTSNTLSDAKFYTAESGNTGSSTFSIPSGATARINVVTADAQKRYYVFISENALGNLRKANNLSDLNDASAARTNLGIGNINNTADANKPISTATQSALDDKAPLASPTFTGTVSGISKSMIGLGSVDNTADADKPVSTATQTALDDKAPLASPSFSQTLAIDPQSTAYDNTSFADKNGLVFQTYTQGGSVGAVSNIVATGSVSGNWPSEMAFQTRENGASVAEKMRITSAGNVGIGTSTPGAKLEVVGAVKIVDGQQGAGKVLTSDANGLATWSTPAVGGSGDLVSTNNLSDLGSASTARTNLGLGNLDNTSDANKPVSTATQTALDAKAPLASPTFTGTLTTPNLVAGGITYPTSNGTNGQVLTTNGSGTLSWSTPASASLTNFTESNYTYSSRTGTKLLATNASSNVDIVLQPKGNGGILAQQPSGSTSGGDNRGTNAVDLQTAGRTASTQVASGTSATVGGGMRNTASGLLSVVAGGSTNTASNTGSGVLGGGGNTASGYVSAVLGGQNNTASGDSSSVAGGAANTASGGLSFVSGFSNTAQSYGESVFGYYATVGSGTASSAVSTDRLFVVGNGTSSVRSNAFSLLKNGNASFSGTITAGSVTYPSSHGTSGQVLTTNGSGTLSWTTPASGGSGDLVSTNNLSDLASASTARTNLGLGNVDNTSDANKPISTATQTALDLKAPLASPTFTGTPIVPTATAGTNTTQAASTAFVKDAIDTKAANYLPLAGGEVTGQTAFMDDIHIKGGKTSFLYNTANTMYWGLQNTSNDLAFALNGSEMMRLNEYGKLGVGTASPDEKFHVVGKVKIVDGNQGPGKVLTSDANGVGTWTTPASGGSGDLVSTNNLSDLASASTARTNLGLGNLDNTSDVNKPVSTATQTALDLKAPLASPTFTGTVSGITATMVGLGSVDNTSDADKPVSTATQTALDLKAPLASPTFTGTVTAPTLTAGGITYPTANGTSGQVLTTNGSGTASWVSASGATALDGLTDAKVAGSGFAGSMIIGHRTTGSLDNAQYNTALGLNAMKSLTSGDDNVAMGNSALTANTSGTGNTAIGYTALNSNTSGSRNIAIGRESGYSNLTGDHNVTIGEQAGRSNTAGSDNIFIGYQAGYNETASNKLYIANSNTSTPLIYGDFSTPALTVNGALTINGNGTSSTFPTGRGSSGQVLSTNGSGTLSWATPSASVADNSITGAKIALGSDAQGDIMYYNGTDYVRLAAGTSGQVLQTNGAGANPTWVTPSSGGSSPTFLTKSADYTITSSDATNGLVLLNTSSPAWTAKVFTLPLANSVSAGKTIYLTGALAYTINAVTQGSDTIVGAGIASGTTNVNTALSSNVMWIQLMSNGSDKWIVIGMVY